MVIIMDSKLAARLNEYFENFREEMVENISSLVCIPSVKGEPQNGKPFGEKPYEALRTALNTADKMGLKTKNFDGYVGTVDLNDKDTNLAVFAHLDVVDAGEGWSSPAFELTEDCGKITGRGVSDDKGPAIAALYAVRAVKDLEIPMLKNVKLIFGTDEECGSADLDYYFKTQSAPPYSFTPDASFPVVNGEKGRFSKKFNSFYKDENAQCHVKLLESGVAANAVPSFAEAEVAGIKKDITEWKALLSSVKTNTDFSVEKIHGGVRIICTGTSAHASTPELGNNPITAMLTLLSNLPLDDCESTRRIKSLASMFTHGDYYGKSFGINMEDELGKLTLSLNMLYVGDGKVIGCFDSRTPMCATYKNCAKIVADILMGNGFKIENTEMIPYHYVDENSKFVKALNKNYELFTGNDAECMTMGGGTYVHNIEGGVAFGAIPKGLETNMHGANEFMFVDDLITAAKIYAASIIEICGI